MEKEGSLDIFGGNCGFCDGFYAWTQAADSGEKIGLQTLAAFGSNATGEINSYVFSRSPEGWGYAAVTPANSGVKQYMMNVFNPDWSKVGSMTWEGTGFGPATHLGSPQGLEFGNVGGPYTEIGPTIAATSSERLGWAETTSQIVGASRDFSHVVFESMDHSLAPAAAGEVEAGAALYEYNGGEVKLVNVETDGTLTSPCGAKLGFYPTQGFDRNAVSADGSKVFFTSPDFFAQQQSEYTGSPLDPSCFSEGEPTANAPQLYMRVGGAETVEVSAPEPGVEPENTYRVFYVGAAEDGSRVFFLTQTELTADDAGIHTLELYEYNTATGTLTRISRGDSGTAAGKVSWIVTSDDGSTVYFAAGGQLAPGAPDLSGTSEENLYRYDTATGETTYITTVGQDWHTLAPDGSVANDTTTNWYVTPDGRFLILFSRNDLTGQNTSERGELYRYDREDESLTCVSCLSDPAAASGDAEFTAVSSNQNEVGSAIRPSRPISEDGSRVFFDTPDALVPQDTNGKRDVYEWHEGTVSLISSGKDGTNSYFLDSSADGRDVFIGTHGQLALTDTDASGDLYDVRVGGGFPFVAEEECAGESCQGSTGGQPGEASPGTGNFVGTGNVREGSKHCPRGTRRVRRHGRVRCVRRHHRHHRRAGSSRRAAK
ncbi:MAG TPA: hypothetical protein VF009_05070 [Solirubrobacterales bacterium]